MSTFSEYVNRSARAAGYDLSGPRSGGRKALAEAAGMGQTAVGRMLAGQCLPNPYVLPNLATALSVPVEDLLRLVGLLPETRKDTGGAPVAAEARFTDRNGDEWVSCSDPHCPNSERYAKAAERGWQHGHTGAWRCPRHRTSPTYASTRGEPGGDA